MFHLSVFRRPALQRAASRRIASLRSASRRNATFYLSVFRRRALLRRARQRNTAQLNSTQGPIMKPSFEMSANTRLLRQHLATTQVGGIVTYEELTKVISSPVTGGTSYLQSALRSLLRNERIVFASVRGVGVQRLNDREIVAAATADVDGIRRRAKRSVVKITAISDYDKLPAIDQLAHTTRLSVFTAIADIASDRGLKKVEKAAAGRATELPIADTLKAFTG